MPRRWKWWQPPTEPAPAPAPAPEPVPSEPSVVLDEFDDTAYDPQSFD